MKAISQDLFNVPYADRARRWYKQNYEFAKSLNDEDLHISMFLSGISPILTNLGTQMGFIKKGISGIRNQPSPTLEELSDSFHLKELKKSNIPFSSLLTQFKVEHLIRLVLLDFYDEVPQEKCLKEWSLVADSILNRAFDFAFGNLCRNTGYPFSEISDPKPYILFALGKLGGMELNYASDVDIVLIYPEDGTIGNMPSREFFIHLFQNAAQVLTASTPEGLCFRVDPDLRPLGRDGDLAISSPSLSSYMNNWAENWERQAWIKARPCAGDRNTGSMILRRISNLIYKKYSFAGIAIQIERLREASMAKENSPSVDIKLGRGGIRDIEFTAQALQICYGQDDIDLRTSDTLNSVERLMQKGYLTHEESVTLAGGYKLFRKIEHFFQIEDLRAVARTPVNEDEWNALSIVLRTESKELKNRLKTLRTSIYKIFIKTIKRLKDMEKNPTRIDLLISRKGITSLLNEIGVHNTERVFPLIDRAYRRIRQYIENTHREEAFMRIHYSLRGELASTSSPDEGITRFATLIGAISRETDLVPYILDHPRIPRVLLRLVRNSLSLHEMLIQYPHLIKTISHDSILSLDSHIAKIKEIKGIENLRQEFRRLYFLCHCYPFIINEPLPTTLKRLSNLASSILNNLFSIICMRLGSSGNEIIDKTCILALGRCGSGEMQPDSDLDIIFLKKDGPSPIDNNLAEKIVRAMVNELTLVTRMGAFYDIDMMLRPFGSSGPPISTPSSFLNYIRKDARAWERIAYLRLNPVAGNTNIGALFAKSAFNVVFEKGFSTDDISYCDNLRKQWMAKKGIDDIKFGEGGLFQLQIALQICHIRLKNGDVALSLPDLIMLLKNENAFSEEEAALILKSHECLETALWQERMKSQKTIDLKKPRKTVSSLYGQITGIA